MNLEEESLKTFWRDVRNREMPLRYAAELVWNYLYSHPKEFLTRKQFIEDNHLNSQLEFIVVNQVWNDIENNDTLIYWDFNSYYENLTLI